MVKSLEVEIKKDIERAREETSNPARYFFINFDANLPGGYRTSGDAEFLNKKLYSNDRRSSERRRGQTNFEFQEECKTAVIEAGFTPEEIVEARKCHAEFQDMSLFEIMEPIYIILRKRGYNSLDLRA